MSLAIAKRVALAGLLPVAERVAAEHKIHVAALLGVTGRVSPAQAALFRAMAETKSPAEIAALLGWGESAVVKALGLKTAPVTKRQPGLTPTDVRAMIEAAVAPLQAEIAELRKRLLAPLSIPEDIEAHLRAQGAAGDFVRMVAAERGVPIVDLLTGRRTKRTTGVRREIVRGLTERFRMSQPDIAAVLRVDRASVVYQQQQASVPAACPRTSRTVAA